MEFAEAEGDGVRVVLRGISAVWEECYDGGERRRREGKLAGGLGSLVIEGDRADEVVIEKDIDVAGFGKPGSFYEEGSVVRGRREGEGGAPFVGVGKDRDAVIGVRTLQDADAGDRSDAEKDRKRVGREGVGIF